MGTAKRHKDTKPLNVTRRCRDCAYVKSERCPNSSECYSLPDKPRFVPHERFSKGGHVARRFSNNVVIASVIAVSVFTALAFVGQFMFHTDIPSHWWAAWFGFWTVEIVTLASITHRKIKQGVDKPEETVEGEEGPNG